VTKDTTDYVALEARLTDPDTTLTSAGQVATGEAAAAAGRGFLLREYGSAEAIQRAMVAPGRPRVGQPGGPSPTVRGRITPADRAALKELQQQTGRTESDLVREAVHQMLVSHKLVS
jgi:hypothetical protein